MYSNLIDHQEIRKRIDRIKIKKVVELDEINEKVVEAVKYEIVQLLSKFVNVSFDTGIFPMQLKDAKVKPLFKSGIQEDTGNYRPISILPSFLQIIE